METCLLVGLIQAGQNKWVIEDHLDELRELAQTAGAKVAEMFMQERSAPDPAYFIGKGKAEEIAMFVEMNTVDIVIFDDELSPAQTRNLEKLFEIKVIDRAALILDIFAAHARSGEARTQVELAQLNYLLPRLTRQWSHLSRQVGGIGTKGPGETQLETDRRLVRTRIANLKKRLQKIEKQTKTQRQKRSDIFRAALIGYTNAGKSTLMNAVTNSDVMVEDKLFATLDTTIRKLSLSNDNHILLSDTVGFIRKLPHHLIASFRSTLAEAIEADLLIHVVDATQTNYKENIEVVSHILNDLEVGKKPQLLVFNKVDLIKTDARFNELKHLYPEALFISAKRHIGINSLRKSIDGIISMQYEVANVKVDYSNGQAENRIYKLAKVIDKKFDEKYIYFTIKYPLENRSKILALWDELGIRL
ncbi:GTPase HflX [bacterium]|nr:GTPase HflX [bacterium]